MQRIFANAKLILDQEVIKGAVHIRDGIVHAIDTGTAVPAGAEDCEGDFISPGLIELHTDNMERHLHPRPRVDWPHGAAILGHDAEMASVGVTTVFDAIRVGSITSTENSRYPRFARALASEIQAMNKAGVLKLDHRLHLRAEVCSETLPEELAEFGDVDWVGIVSIMDHTPGQRQFRDLAKFETYVRSKRGFSEAQFKKHIKHLMGLQSAHGAAHEAVVLATAKRLNATLASHDDTTAEQVQTSASYGVSMAEFPTTMEAAQACRAAGQSIIMGAPNLVRGGSHSGNVAAIELARADLLDIVSSDYVPSALLLSAVQLGTLWGDMARGLATVTTAPAHATGLTDRGQLAVGKRADLIRFGMLEGAPVLKSVWRGGQRIS